MAKRTYGFDDHFKAAMTYIVTGSAHKTSKVCGIPWATVKDWTNRDWWPDIVGEARKQKNEALDAILTEGIHLGLGNYLERITKGDAYVAKDGTIKFKPMGGKESAVAAAVLVDKRTILRGDPTRITKSTTDNKEMATLQKALDTIGEKNDLSMEVVQH